MAEPALGARLTGDLTSLALCWRLVRSDGVALGFTSHDAPLLVDGLPHDHAPGITPSAVVLSDGVAADTLDVAGALAGSAITAADLAAGRWDGAQARLCLVDWQAPDGGQQLLADGVLGAVESGLGADAGFSATVLGPAARLAAAAVATCSPECRAVLGDAACAVPLRRHVRRLAVAACDGRHVGFAGIVPADHVEGRLRVIDGPLAGIERRLLAVADGALLMDAPLDLVPGTLVMLWEGCDKAFATCRDRFGNAANFQGEPHVPGGDLLIQYGTN